MYKIDSKVDKPDTAYLYRRAVEMMNRGVRVGNLDQLYNACLRDEEAYKKDINIEYGISNPNSSAQVIKYLENLCDQNVVEACTVNDKWTSNKQSLQIVESLGYKAAGDIIQYRTVKKYADSIKGIIDASRQDGMIHPEVTMTKTNRIGYKNPALMNIPKNLLWDCIVPMNSGDILISADIKNQEPNILINMNNVESLKDCLKSEDGLYESIFNSIPITCRLNILVDNSFTPGIVSNKELSQMKNVPPVYYTPNKVTMNCIKHDGKTLKLIDVINLAVPVGGTPVLPEFVTVQFEDGSIDKLPIKFNEDFTSKKMRTKLNSMGIIELDGEISGIYKECTGVVRKEFKRAWNAMTYGASIVGIRQMCHNIDGDLVYKYFSGIPEIKNYRDKCTKLANSGNQSIGTYFGTELIADEYNTKVLRRVLMDLPVQGTAADILSLLVKHFDDEVEKRGQKGKLFVYYTRHDELIIEASKELIDTIGLSGIKDEISDIVTHQVDDWVPFKVDIEPISIVDILKIVEANSDDE